MVSLEELLQLLEQRGGSDLHIASGSPPRIRIDGKLMPTEFDTLTKEESQKLVYGVLSEDQIARFEKDLELDFSFGVDNLGRFRTNVFLQRKGLSAVFRPEWAVVLHLRDESPFSLEDVDDARHTVTPP